VKLFGAQQHLAYSLNEALPAITLPNAQRAQPLLNDERIDDKLAVANH
jgi:hypothetical protein